MMKDIKLLNALHELSQVRDRTVFLMKLEKLVNKYKNGRDSKQHRQLWKLAENVAENTQDANWNTADKVVNQCKIELRFIDSWFTYANPKNKNEQKLHLNLKSISFADCSQDDFDIFFDGAIEIMAKKLNITTSELLRS